MRKFEGAGFIALACSLAACGAGEPDWAGTIVDSAGVTIVSNPAEGIWSAGEEWTFEEEVRIGTQDGSPEYELGAVAAIAVDSRERIFVLDGQAQHIRVYSSDGIYEETFGGRGGGPGELQAAMTLLMGPGDTLLVPDGRSLRINRYEPNGSSAGSFRMVLEQGRPMRFKASPSGLVAEQIRPLSTLLPGEQGTESPMDAIVLVAMDGTVTDTLLTFRPGQSLSPQGVTLYGAERVWDLTDELQLVVGAPEEFRISLYAAGRLRRIFTKPFERKPVADRDTEAILSEMERRWDEGGVSPETRQRIWSRIHFADFYPAIQDVAVGPAGTVWAQRVKPASELSAKELEFYHERPAPDWDVFDPQGRFLGVATMPARFNPMLFRGGSVFGVLRGELDEQYVVRLRIVTPSEVGLRAPKTPVASSSGRDRRGWARRAPPVRPTG